MMKNRKTKSNGLTWYMVTDAIEGNVNNTKIKAQRGDHVQLTPDQANLFKDRILEINYGVLTGQRSDKSNV